MTILTTEIAVAILPVMREDGAERELRASTFPDPIYSLYGRKYGKFRPMKASEAAVYLSRP